MNAAEQQRTLLEVGSFKYWPKKEYCYSKHEIQGCDRAAKNDYGSIELVGFFRFFFFRKYMLLVFYYCPDKYVILVFMLALGRGRVFVNIHYTDPGHNL